MTLEVWFRDGGPRLAAGSGGASAILVVKRGNDATLEHQNFTARCIRRRADAFRDIVPRRDLAMRGVTKVEAFRAVLAAEPRRISADNDSHGLERLVIAKIAALPCEDCGDVIFDGYCGGEENVAFAGLNLKREISGNGGKLEASMRIAPEMKISRLTPASRTRNSFPAACSDIRVAEFFVQPGQVRHCSDPEAALTIISVGG